MVVKKFSRILKKKTDENLKETAKTWIRRRFRKYAISEVRWDDILKII